MAAADGILQEFLAAPSARAQGQVSACLGRREELGKEHKSCVYLMPVRGTHFSCLSLPCKCTPMHTHAPLPFPVSHTWRVNKVRARAHTHTHTHTKQPLEMPLSPAYKTCTPPHHCVLTRAKRSLLKLIRTDFPVTNEDNRIRVEAEKGRRNTRQCVPLWQD